MKALLLIIWLLCDLAFGVFCLGGSVYLAIWKHCSGWWVVLGILLTCSSFTMLKCMKYYFKSK